MTRLTLSSGEIRRLRLRGLHLDNRSTPDFVVDVVRDTGGIQAQVMSAAEMALGVRTKSTRDFVSHALWVDRSLVKTWCMRGAIHLLPADELTLFLSAYGRNAMRNEERVLLRRGFTGRDIARSCAAIVTALDGRSLTRKELAHEVGKRLGGRFEALLESSWGALIKPAALEGLVCFGPNRGREVTFVRVDQWLGSTKGVKSDDARTLLLQRYIRAYGPVSMHDYAHWSGIGVRNAAQQWVDHDHGTVDVFDECGRAFRVGVEALKSAPGVDERSTRLLPAFDPYLLGYRGKDHVVRSVDYKCVYKKAGWISPVALVDGHVIGVWRCRRVHGRLRVEIQAFGETTDTELAGIEAEVSELGRFLRLAAEVTPQAGEAVAARKTHGGRRS